MFQAMHSIISVHLIDDNDDFTTASASSQSTFPVECVNVMCFDDAHIIVDKDDDNLHKMNCEDCADQAHEDLAPRPTLPVR